MRGRVVLPLVVLALLAGVVGAGTAGAARRAPAPKWAPAASATVTPGVMTYTDGLQCTANFVFTDGKGTAYLGQSAHCASLSGSAETNGCRAKTRPVGTPVTVRGATRPGVLAYSSWAAMQRVGERDASTCAFNDFALIRLDPADVARTNPSVPRFGGPVGLDVDGTRPYDTVLTYGNSSLRGGLAALRPKQGWSLGTSGGGWTHTVYTATPGIPGDSGSAVLDEAGRALGTLSTVALFPLAASNGVSDLARQIAYARANGVPGLTLVPGTEAFTGPLA